MKQFDPFRAQKETSLEKAIPGITVMLTHLANVSPPLKGSDDGSLSKHFETFVKVTSKVPSSW